MRNIIQYPITAEEVLDALTNAAKQEGVSFSVRPFILHGLRKILEARPLVLEFAVLDINKKANVQNSN